MVTAARRWRSVLLKAGLVLVVAVWAAVATVAVFSARSQADDGRQIVEALRRDVHGAGDLRSDDSILRRLRGARAHFRTARARVRSPVLAPLRVLPVVGRQVRALDSLARAADQATAVGIDAVTNVRSIAEHPPTTPAGRVRVARDLEGVATRAHSRLAALDLGPDHGLIGPIADAHDRMASQLGEILSLAGDAQAVSRSIGDLLAGPGRQLVFAANNSEMRAGSGMFLLVGELATSGGSVHLGPMQSVGDVPVPAGAVPLHGDLAARWGWLDPNADWRNLMLSPQFPQSAELAARMWQASGHRRPDGVLVLDPIALRDILSVTGPVEVGGQRIGPSEVVEDLLHTQYLTATSRTARQDQLAAVAEATFARLDAGGWNVLDLADALSRAGRGRHLMAWSGTPSAQRGWAAAHIDGALDPESLLVSVINRGGNKLDWFLRVRAGMTIRRRGSRTEVTLRLDVHNATPAGQPVAVAGPNPPFGLAAGDHRAIIAVSLPGAARHGRIDGVRHLAVAGADGPTRVLATQVEISRGHSRQVTVRFDLPTSVRTLRVEASARWQPTKWDFGTQTWRDARNHTVHL